MSDTLVKAFYVHFAEQVQACPEEKREFLLANFAIGFLSGALGPGEAREQFLAVKVGGATCRERIQKDIETLVGV